MINGEGTEEKSSSAVTSPSDPHGDRESDGGDDLSHYSSCGGESEFERYCSASSAMGTPSFRGSSFHDSDFGSLKGFKLGGENTDFKMNGEERVLFGYSVSECCDEKNNGLNLNGRVDVDLRGNFDVDGDWGNEVVIDNEMEGSSNRDLRIPGEEGSDREGLDIEGCKDRNLSDEGEASSRCDHSEGEDSMFGCGSDDERNIDMYYVKNAALHGGESRLKENQVVMNSAVAFGSDDWDDFVQGSSEIAVGPVVWNESSSLTAGNSVAYPNIVSSVGQENVRNTAPAFNYAEAGGELAATGVNALSTISTNLAKLNTRTEAAKGEFTSSNQVDDIDELNEYLGSSSVENIFRRVKDPFGKPVTANEEITIGEIKSDIKNKDMTTSEVISHHQDIAFKKSDTEETNIVIKLDPYSDSVVDHKDPLPEVKKDKETKSFEGNTEFETPMLGDTNRTTTTKMNFSSAFDRIENHFLPVKTRDFELNDFCDEIVNDMEDILLDSAESPASRFTHGRINQPHFPRSSRDGGSSASTSGTDYAYNGIQQPLKIDRVEVVGASQRKGDVSFSERLVGVQKYTVYKIRVWSGEDHWEVERRYRDFNTLYYRLKKLFADNGWTLPSSWSSVGSESRKLFGNSSPDVIADRTVLIQECLQSIIHPRFSSFSFNALACFLSPSDTVPDSPASDTSSSQSPLANKRAEIGNFSTLGQTISLVVENRPLKSMKQMLDAQHYRCAGCHISFDDGSTRVMELVKALGWGKPRLCEYSCQLFCSSCHINDTAVLPAKVLHYWDFTRYPVSQLAKSFLDSINDQPMLCVSAVNPFLFTKVPTLQHVANIRSRIRVLLPYVRCPFRRSIHKGLGSRRYLLDSNDFFALKDLIDLSKGVFSVLPVMVETVSRKIEQHITDQCLICYDVGIPCSARQECEDPLSLIFPFQEGGVEKCRSCESIFHKNCFKKLASCPCGARFKQEETKRIPAEAIQNGNRNLSLPGGTAEPSSGLLSGLFSKVMPVRSQILRNQEPKAGNVIPMGSLPYTSL